MEISLCFCSRLPAFWLFRIKHYSVGFASPVGGRLPSSSALRHGFRRVALAFSTVKDSPCRLPASSRSGIPLTPESAVSATPSLRSNHTRPRRLDLRHQRTHCTRCRRPPWPLSMPRARDQRIVLGDCLLTSGERATGACSCPCAPVFDGLRGLSAIGGRFLCGCGLCCGLLRTHAARLARRRSWCVGSSSFGADGSVFCSSSAGLGSANRWICARSRSAISVSAKPCRPSSAAKRSGRVLISGSARRYRPEWRGASLRSAAGGRLDGALNLGEAMRQPLRGRFASRTACCFASDVLGRMLQVHQP